METWTDPTGFVYPACPESVQQKYMRVLEHLARLQMLRDSFSNDDAPDLTHRVEADGLEHVYLAADDLPEVPPEVNILIGECLFHLRSMLDYLALQLVPTADRTSHERSSQFPISKSPHDWKSDKSRVKGAPAAAVAVIEGMQPYQPSPNGKVPLWWLNTLSNIDKHRVPVVASAAVSVIYVNDPAERLKTNPGAWDFAREPVRVVGDEFARLTLSTPASDLNIGVRIGYELAFFEDGVKKAPVVDTLSQIAFVVRYLVVNDLQQWL